MKKRGFSLACWLLEVLERRFPMQARRAPDQVYRSLSMLNASLLSIIEAAGIAVLTLTEGLEKDEFLSSRLTRAEARRQMKIMSDSAANLAPDAQATLAEVDWSGWHAIARQLGDNPDDPHAEQEALWFAVRSLVPATLMWLRVYRTNQPEVFECKPAAGGASA
jgi:uncharacterized protein with HEPN domain